MLDLGRKIPYSDALRDYGKWTLAEEPYSDIQLEWEACTAEMVKSMDGDALYVKCMEPAVWYVRSSHGGLTGLQNVFCEYHKPRVVPNV